MGDIFNGGGDWEVMGKWGRYEKYYRERKKKK